MIFWKDLFSIPIEYFKDLFVLAFDLTSMEEVTEKCWKPKLVEEPPRLELNYIFLHNTFLNSLY